MSVYSFSVKDSRPTDAAVVEAVKKYCEEKGINFSRAVVEALALWLIERDMRKADGE